MSWELAILKHKTISVALDVGHRKTAATAAALTRGVVLQGHWTQNISAHFNHGINHG